MHPVHPLARKNKHENREKKEDFTFSADDEPSWRGGLSVCSGRRWSVRTLFGSDELGSAKLIIVEHGIQGTRCSFFV
jgi:hypothetical protein